MKCLFCNREMTVRVTLPDFISDECIFPDCALEDIDRYKGGRIIVEWTENEPFRYVSAELDGWLFCGRKEAA